MGILAQRSVLREGWVLRDPDYIADIHDQPCCICEAFGELQLSPTQAHHTICGRFSSDKTPDYSAIPLCEGHHLGHFDNSKLAIHSGKASWVSKYGPDTDWIKPTQDKIWGDDAP